MSWLSVINELRAENSRLKAENERLLTQKTGTGIFIRAQINGKWDSVDIADERLTDEEVLNWLRSRGGINPWAENCVLLLLGRKQIAKAPEFEFENTRLKAQVKELKEALNEILGQFPPNPTLPLSHSIIQIAEEALSRAKE